MYTRFITILAVFVAYAQASELPAPTVHNALISHSNDSVDLNVLSRQAWVQEYGRRGCLFANRVRRQYGRHQLYYSASLTNLAARHSRWMAAYNRFQHQNLRGLGVRVGRHWLPVTAENIAWSVPRSRDAAADAHQQWYHSRGHFLNMISTSHTHCGVGFAFDRRGNWWGTQLFGRNYAFGNEGGAGVSAPPAPAPAPAPAAAPAPAPVGPRPANPASAPAPGPAPMNAPNAAGGPGITVDFDPNSTPTPREREESDSSNNDSSGGGDGNGFSQEMANSLTGEPLLANI